MNIALYSGSFARYPLETAFKEASRCGYDGIEIWGGRPHAYAYDLNKKGIERLREYVEAYQMPIVCYTPENIVYPYSLVFHDSDMRKSSLEYYRRSLDMAKAMGSPYLLIAVGHPGYSTDGAENWKILTENLHALCDHAEKIGQLIALESVTPYESNLLNSSDDLVHALRAVDSPNLKVVLDLVAPATMYEPVSNYFEKLGTQIAHIHLVDSDGQSDSHLIPGDGILPFEQIFALIERYDYTGFCSVELVSMYMQDPILFSELAVTRIRALATKTRTGREKTLST